MIFYYLALLVIALAVIVVDPVGRRRYWRCVDRGFHRCSFTHECDDCGFHIGRDTLPLKRADE